MASGKNRSRDRSLNDRVDRMKWEIVLETIDLKPEFVISHKNCTDLSKLQFWPIYIIFHTYILFHVIYIWISLIQVRETILQLPIILARRLIRYNNKIGLPEESQNALCNNDSRKHFSVFRWIRPRWTKRCPLAFARKKRASFDSKRSSKVERRAPLWRRLQQYLFVPPVDLLLSRLGGGRL